MAQTPEAKVKASVVKILKRYGAYYFFPATGGYGRSGVPDIVGSYKGRFFAIECKAGNGKPTALQLNELIAINDSGAIAIVVNEGNMQEVAKTMEMIDGLNYV